ncbi:MaoC/PaaZ C-terminal domain-containing protein [Knoellia subterranea]|uniref:MaoC family dehydratase n=1 Tax=Knoellia subterranea KCTC 19937 TaxID=1385521 RepID=A0A0A0JMG1_9MICO|nr:MaoC/PaaZ C-terminal domain-containing protein [Knoellia subterranea]KGN38590.1 MaoC family dehydratase [Knoellia subterranea KCTC 19937]
MSQQETFSQAPSLAKVFVRAAVAGKKSGTSLPASELVLTGHKVDRDHLMSYQRLCGFGVDDVLPHTYPHILGFPLQAELMARSSFPLPLAGLVHVENTITVRRLLTADDVLDVAIHAEGLRDHAKGRQVDLVTEVTVEGESVWSGRSTYLARGKGNPDAERGAEPPAVPQGIAAAQWSLPGDLGRQYAAISGDVNPIHMHPLTAKAMGFPKAIAHGMWTYARVLGALGRHVNGPSTSNVWFKKPVLLPSKVDFVVDRNQALVIAGLRSTRKPEVEHLALTLETAR